MSGKYNKNEIKWVKQYFGTFNFPMTVFPILCGYVICSSIKHYDSKTLRLHDIICVYFSYVFSHVRIYINLVLDRFLNQNIFIFYINEILQYI